jgi:hypothetical protein
VTDFPSALCLWESTENRVKLMGISRGKKSKFKHIHNIYRRIAASKFDENIDSKKEI